MALGFQDCCNRFSFFNVVGIPSTVSEYEVYYIRTVEGVNFCATYREIPVLNYIPPSYILLEMTQQTDCAVCIEANPCPDEETIFINQFLEGSVVVGTDCSVQTLMQMVVECRSTNPTFDDQTDGVVALFVTGGTPPYTFFSADTQEVLSTTMVDDVYTVFPNATEGPYNMVVVDDAGDFIIPITCILDAPPNLPIIVPIMTPATFFGKPDGRIDFDITGGNPPYTIIFEGEIITPPLTNLAAGTYIFQILDEETYQEVSVEVTQPPSLNFPDALCLQLTLCGNSFKITFVRTDELRDYRPIYRSTNASQLGIISMDLYWDDGLMFTGWIIRTVDVQVEDIRWQQEPGVCNSLNSGIFGAAKQAQTRSELPQGSYFGVGIALGQLIPVTPGGCPPSLTAEVLEGYCAGPPVSLGKVQLEAFGGAGPPYTFFYSAGNGGNYTQVNSSLLELLNGTYAIKVRDALGVESTPISVTVPTISNFFNGNQVGFCSTIQNLNSEITGTLTPLDDGQFRMFESITENYFDFSTFPEGAIVSGRFATSFYSDYIGADDGYNMLNDSLEFQFEIMDSYVIQNGVVTSWSTSDFILNGQQIIGGVLQPNNDPGAMLGSNQIFGENYGWYEPFYFGDSCTAYTEPVQTRTSPNYWFDCITPGQDFGSLQYGASFIEGDRRGQRNQTSYSFSSPFLQFDVNTRIYIKIKVRMKNKMGIYIPTTLNETDASTLQPECYTDLDGQTGCNRLNLPNNSNVTLGGYTSYNVRFFLNNVTVVQRPPTPPCWRLRTSGVNNFLTLPGLGAIPSQFNPNSSGINRNFFEFFNSNSQDPSDLFRYRQRNNTCISLPSWAP